MARKDIGHKQTDDIIEQIEKRLQKEYSQAEKELQEKFENYMESFKRKEAIKKKLVAEGKWTEQEYKDWRYGQICIGRRWEEMVHTIAEDLVNVDSIARSITQEHMPEVYAINHNYATFQVERDSAIDTSYTIYNRRTVENLIRNDDTLLPYPRKDSPTDIMLREHKDLIWNQQHIHSAITQGVLQGESIPQIAKRLSNVVGMDKRAATRNARTMMTGVENKARQDAYDDLKAKGVNLSERWSSTLDMRTRHSHRLLHGSYRDPVTGLFANGVQYPGDPKGPPEEVYNCRCRLQAQVRGYESGMVKSSPKMHGMSYEEWLQGGGKAKWENGAQPVYTPPAAVLPIAKNQPTNMIEKIKNTNTYNSLTSAGVKAVQTVRMPVQMSPAEIIQKISGGDKTKGSCASLAYCYAGNLSGYDCNDFRDGKSRDWFSSKANTRGMLAEFGIPYKQADGATNGTQAIRLLRTMEEGKEYILEAGRHMSVVRKQDKEFQFLELQSAYKNGWKSLGGIKDSKTVKRSLNWRFSDMNTTYWQEYSPILVDVDDLKKNEKFHAVLDYINTPVNEQMKGSEGHER